MNEGCKRDADESELHRDRITVLVRHRVSCVSAARKKPPDRPKGGFVSLDSSRTLPALSALREDNISNDQRQKLGSLPSLVLKALRCQIPHGSHCTLCRVEYM